MSVICMNNEGQPNKLYIFKFQIIGFYMIYLNEKLLDFYTKLTLVLPEPLNVDILNPYNQEEVIKVNKQFYDKYYRDNQPRILLFGINPGRFGAGITGISFTDPITLEENLQIKNTFQKKPELSATFIHQMIQEYGGPERFYSKFHLSTVCPLGFVRDNVNMNYYDEANLLKHVRPFMIESIEKQIELLNSPPVCVCIGRGKNLDFLKKLNDEKSYFKDIQVLPHPRWVLQYRRKKTPEYIQEYIQVLNAFKA